MSVPTEPIEPPADPTPPSDPKRQVPIIAAGVAALIVIVAVTFFALRTFGGDSVVEVTLRSLGTSGQDPFTESVAPAPSASLSDYASNPDSGADLDGRPNATLAQYRTVSATVPGVFGGSLDETACDKDALVRFLSSEPAKAEAWASVLAMDVDDIGAYVNGLTGVNLGADTRVLDHGFSDGRLVARQAVLQKGTAVLVDQRGVPRVDCYSGNPLRQPTVAADETFVGTPWTTFAPDEVVVIDDAPSDVSEFELVDVADGSTFTRPAGTTGAADVPGGATEAPDTTPEPVATEVPPTPTPPSATRDLVYGGSIELNESLSTEVGTEESELIYTFDAPPGAKLELRVANDRASVSGVAFSLEFAGDRITFFRVPPGDEESFPLTLGAENAGEYELIVTEGPAAFELVVAAELQDDAGRSQDAGADFASALEIGAGEPIDGHLAGLDRTDTYVLDLAGQAPTLVLTADVERGSDAAVAFDLQMLGDRLEFFRVNPAADNVFELRFGSDDELLELYLTEGPGEYSFTAELVPQRDGGEEGDAGGELPDARALGEFESFSGQVGERDRADYYTFEAPADEFTLTFDVTVDSPKAAGFDILGSDGNRINFVRVQPGATDSIDLTGTAGDTFRLIVNEGRADYEVAIS